MSLATLVHYAQNSFGVRSDSTTELENGSLHTTLAPVRPPIPDWLRNRRPDDEVVTDSAHTWRIHGAVLPSLPLPDVERMGPDALAFYVPFHLYRDDWGSTFAMSV